MSLPILATNLNPKSNWYNTWRVMLIDISDMFGVFDDASRKIVEYGRFSDPASILLGKPSERELNYINHPTKYIVPNNNEIYCYIDDWHEIIGAEDEKIIMPTISQTLFIANVATIHSMSLMSHVFCPEYVQSSDKLAFKLLKSGFKLKELIL